jgi:putative intracellular protease/amidase
MNGVIYVLVFDGYADWEPAFALAELRRTGHREVVTVGFNRLPVVSMGGLQVIPRTTLAEMRVADANLVLVPGGDAWEEEHYPRAAVDRMLRTAADAMVPVAAICSGTVAAARAGLLNDRHHTSNSLDYLRKFAPEYRGHEHYVDMLAVRSRAVITAGGLGPVEFAREIFAELGVFDDVDRGLWFDMFKTGQYHEISG